MRAASDGTAEERIRDECIWLPELAPELGGASPPEREAPGRVRHIGTDDFGELRRGTPVANIGAIVNPLADPAHVRLFR